MFDVISVETNPDRGKRFCKNCINHSEYVNN